MAREKDAKCQCKSIIIIITTEVSKLVVTSARFERDSFGILLESLLLDKETFSLTCNCINQVCYVSILLMPSHLVHSL